MPLKLSNVLVHEVFHCELTHALKNLSRKSVVLVVAVCLTIAIMGSFHTRAGVTKNRLMIVRGATVVAQKFSNFFCLLYENLLKDIFHFLYGQVGAAYQIEMLLDDYERIKHVRVNEVICVCLLLLECDR